MNASPMLFGGSITFSPDYKTGCAQHFDTVGCARPPLGEVVWTGETRTVFYCAAGCLGCEETRPHAHLVTSVSAVQAAVWGPPIDPATLEPLRPAAAPDAASSLPDAPGAAGGTTP